MIKKLIPIVLLTLAALKLGGAEARGQNTPLTFWDIAISSGVLIVVVGYVLFVKTTSPKAEWMSQSWLKQDFAGQNSAVRNQHKR